MALARTADVTVAVDGLDNVAELSDAAASPSCQTPNRLWAVRSLTSDQGSAGARGLRLYGDTVGSPVTQKRQGTSAA